MIRIAHVRNETAMGGIDTFLRYLGEHLGAPFVQRTVVADPARLTPAFIDDDVVVVHMSSIWTRQPYVAWLRAQAPRRPLILVEHHYGATYIRDHVDAPGRFYVMLRAAYGLASRVVSVSQAQATWLRANRLVRPDKLHVIRPSTDMTRLFELPPPSAQSPTDVLHLGAYGRYAPEKGFDTLLAAMQQLSPDKVRLSIRGDGPLREDLLAAARDLPHVSIGGRVHDLAAFLGSVDAVVVPSRREPFGQVATEARAAARPMIVTAVDGLPEQAAPAFADIVPPDDAAALADAIRRLVGRDVGAMGTAARHSVATHAADMLSGWRDLIFDALAMHRPEPATRGAHGAPAKLRTEAD